LAAVFLGRRELLGLHGKGSLEVIRGVGGAESADDVPVAELRWVDAFRRFGTDVAVEAESVEAVAEQHVRLAVAVEIAPGGRGEVISDFARQSLGIVAELSFAEVGEEARAVRRGEQKIG